MIPISSFSAIHGKPDIPYFFAMLYTETVADQTDHFANVFVRDDGFVRRTAMAL